MSTSTIHQRTFVTSNTFKEYYDQCMSFDNGFKGKPWPKVVLIPKCNELIQGFINNKQHKSFRRYFKATMAKRHPKRATMIKHILLFFFSMEKHAKECYEVEIIFRLFNEKLEKGLYKDWVKIKTVIAKLLKINIRELKH
jgi:hypothetical protein